MNYDLQLLKTLIYFILIIISIVLIAKFLRKYLHQQKQGKYINIIEQLYLGQKKSLSLIKVNDKVFLLGVGNDKVEKLYEWTLEEFEEIDTGNNQKFRDKFESILKKNWRDRNE